VSLLRAASNALNLGPKQTMKVAEDGSGSGYPQSLEVENNDKSVDSGVAYFQTNSWLSAVALRCYLLDREAKERFQLGGLECF